MCGDHGYTNLTCALISWGTCEFRAIRRPLRRPGSTPSRSSQRPPQPCAVLEVGLYSKEESSREEKDANRNGANPIRDSDASIGRLTWLPAAEGTPMPWTSRITARSSLARTASNTTPPATMTKPAMPATMFPRPKKPWIIVRLALRFRRRPPLCRRQDWRDNSTRMRPITEENTRSYAAEPLIPHPPSQGQGFPRSLAEIVATHDPWDAPLYPNLNAERVRPRAASTISRIHVFNPS